VAPKRRLPAEERRALIAAAAAARFAESGYDATTLDEIAAAAGVTKPILYRHFGSKKELYRALLARHRDDLPSFLTAAAEAGPEPTIEAILDDWLAYARRNSHGWRMLFRDRGGDAEIAALREETMRRAREVLVAWLASRPAPRVPAAELEPTAEIIRAGLAGLVLWWIDRPDVPREHLVAAASRIVGPLAPAPHEQSLP
jgi:AcrR family transcriptional regulator